MTENELKQQLAKSQLERIYLIIGEDALLKKKYLDRIVAACVTGGARDFDLSDLDGKSLDIDMLCDELIRFPLMSQKRCVVVTNLPFTQMRDGDKKRLLSAIKTLPETVCFVIYQSGIAVDYKKQEGFAPLIRAADSCGAVLNFGHKTAAELRAAIREYCRRRGVRLDNSAADYMIETCSQDLGILRSEADKLCRFKGENQAISRADIDAVCARTPTARIFDLAGAIISRSAEKAMNIIDGLLFEGLAPAQICSVLISSFIDIYRVGAALEAGQSPDETARVFGYPKNKLFLLDRARPIAKRMSAKERRKCLLILLDADRKLKSTGYDARAALESAALALVSR